MVEKKSIAFLCHPYHRGGVTRWMTDAAIAATATHEVYFITVYPVKPFFSGKGRETLLQLLAKEKNDVRIITTNAGYEFEFGTPEYRAYVYRKLLVQLPPGTPVILGDDGALWEAAATLHASYPIVGVLHADENHYYDLAKKYYVHVDVFACVSSRVSKITKGSVPEFDAGHVYTIPCGINLPRMEMNVPTNDVLQLVYAGRISDYQKRTGDLFKICTLLAEMKVKFHLNIIGDGGAAKTNLVRQFKEAGMQEYVTFCGWLSQQEVARYLSKSDVLILTSDFEGTPIAMMEALAAGCGMVGTRVSGIEDYEYHRLAADCLAVYAVGDIEDAVNKINKVAAIPASRRKQAARKLAETEFSMRVCLEKYFKAIDMIPARAAKPGGIKLPFFALLYSKAIARARYLRVSFKG